MVDAEQDVLDAKSQVGRCLLELAGSWLDHKRRGGRRQPDNPNRTIHPCEPHQYIREGRRQAVDGDTVPIESARAGEGGTLMVSFCGQKADHLGRQRAMFGKLGMDTELQVVARWYFPAHLKGFWASLAQFQIAGPQLVGVEVPGDQHGQEQDEIERQARHGVTAACVGAGAPSVVGRSTMTV
jgi:hypothetical protein